MRIPGRKAAVGAVRWLRSRARERVLVLGYHRITDATNDVYGLAVSPSHFREQMDVLVRLAAPARLRDVVTSLSHGNVRSNTVVVTFDDGYADTLDVALPALERADVPATVFVVSGYIGREFWWDELARLAVPRRNGNGAAMHANGGAASPSARTVTTAAAGLSALWDSDRRHSLEAMARDGDTDEPVHRALTADELTRLARSRLIEIGGHTVTHPLLPRLSEAEQRCELEDCRRTLEAIVGRAVFSFSYPHGALSPVTTRLVRESGYTAGCSSTPDVVTRRSNLLALPRFWVGDWDGVRFERFLRRWLLD